MDLRKRKKLEREKRIMKAASMMFKTEGFAKTSMNAIAREADLGVGTLYNYFKSKDELFIHMVKSEIIDDIEHPEPLAEDAHHSISSILLHVLNPFLNMFPLYDKNIWRDLYVAVINNRHSLDSEVFALDWMIVEKLSFTIDHLKENGMINRDLDTEKTAMTLFGSIMLVLNMYILVPEMDIEGLRAELLSSFSIVENGLRPE